MNLPVLLILLICHWAGDFTHLSRPFMLRAKRLGTPVMPIFYHALVHAVLMAFAVEAYLTFTVDGYNPFEFAATVVDSFFVIQLVSHFFIDLLKGKMNGWFPSLQDSTGYPHWYVFGLDQLLHISIIILMASLI